jgi:hypothetical protein
MSRMLLVGDLDRRVIPCGQEQELLWRAPNDARKAPALMPAAGRAECQRNPPVFKRPFFARSSLNLLLAACRYLLKTFTRKWIGKC